MNSHNKNKNKNVVKEKFSVIYNSFEYKKSKKYLESNKKLNEFDGDLETLKKLLKGKIKNLRNFFSHYSHKKISFEEEEQKILEEVFKNTLEKVKKNFRGKEQNESFKYKEKYLLFTKERELTSNGNVFFLSFFVTRDYLNYFIKNKEFPLKEALIHFSLRPAQSSFCQYNKNFLKVLDFFDLKKKLAGQKSLNLSSYYIQKTTLGKEKFDFFYSRQAEEHKYLKILAEYLTLEHQDIFLKTTVQYKGKKNKKSEEILDKSQMTDLEKKKIYFAQKKFKVGENENEDIDHYICRSGNILLLYQYENKIIQIPIGINSLLDIAILLKQKQKIIPLVDKYIKNYLDGDGKKRLQHKKEKQKPLKELIFNKIDKYLNQGKNKLSLLKQEEKKNPTSSQQ